MSAYAARPHGFVWGNMEITRMMILPNGGHVLNVRAVGKDCDEGMEIYLSPGGRSIRVWHKGRELK